MKRKVIQQGLGGRTIFLPIAWIRDNKISVGDDVELSIVGKEIHISRSLKTPTKSKEIDLDHPLSGPLLRTIISSCYKAGYTDLVINSESYPSVKNIHEIVSSFTGMEIITYGEKSLRVKAFIQHDEGEIENLIIKMFQMLKTIAAEVDEGWEAADVQKVTYMLEMSLRKMRDLILRSIHSTAYGADKTYDYYEFVTILEKIGGEFMEIAKYISLNKPKRSVRIGGLIKYLDEFYMVFLKKDFATAHRLWMKIGELKSDAISHDKNSRMDGLDDPGLMMHYYLQRWLYKHLASRLVSLCRY